MSNVIVLTVQGNTAPAFQVTLKRNGTVINLVGATVKLSIMDAQTREVTNAGHQSATLVDAANGVIGYTPQIGDFNDGRHFGKAIVTYTGGAIEQLHEVVQIIARKA